MEKCEVGSKQQEDGSLKYQSPFIAEPQEWIQTSDHDSCWRSDGFRGVDQIWGALMDRMPGEHKDKTASCWIDDIQQVNVELEKYDAPSGLRRMNRPKKVWK